MSADPFPSMSALKIIENNSHQVDQLDQPLWFLYELFSKNRTQFYSADYELLEASIASNPHYLRFISLLFCRTRKYSLSIRACEALINCKSYVAEAQARIVRSKALLASALNNSLDPDKFAKIYLSTFSSLIERNQSELNSYHSRVSTSFNSAVDVAAINKQVPNLLEYSRIVSRIKDSESIALVGNSAKLKGASKGSEIDSHDCVVRINFAYSANAQKDIGEKTDIMISSNQHFSGSENIAHSLSALSMFPSIPCLLMDCSHLVEEPLPPKHDLVNKIVSMPSYVRSLISPIAYTHATTGLSAIVFLVGLMKKKVTLYGFDFYEKYEKPYYHTSMSLEPSILHEIHYERALGLLSLSRIFDSASIS